MVLKTNTNHYFCVVYLTYREKKPVFPLAFSFLCSQHNPINTENMQWNLISTCHIFLIT